GVKAAVDDAALALVAAIKGDFLGMRDDARVMEAKITFELLLLRSVLSKWRRDGAQCGARHQKVTDHHERRGAAERLAQFDGKEDNVNGRFGNVRVEMRQIVAKLVNVLREE